MLAGMRRSLDRPDHPPHPITSQRHHPEETTGPGLASFADTQEDTIAETHRVCNLGPVPDDIPANEGAPQGHPAQGSIGLQPIEQQADPVDPADNDGLDRLRLPSSGAGASSGRRERTSAADRL